MGYISDKEFTNAALMWSRANVNSLSNLILESANSELRNECLTVLSRAYKYQEQIFDVMSEYGWYQTQMANVNDVKNAKQKVEQQVTNVLNTVNGTYY